MIYRLARRDEILPLRALVLRAGKPIETAQFAEDAHPECFHFGAFSDRGCEACLTIFPAPWQGNPAWQLRGMAVHPEQQGKGVGTTLLELAVDFAIKRGTASQMWCNARKTAVPFYERLGWKTFGETFEVAGIGPHVKMFRGL
jgi:GNAT superfamily N-acetyltransferase